MSIIKNDLLNKSIFNLDENDLQNKIEELNEYIILSASNDYNYNNSIYNDNLNIKIEFCKYLSSALKIIQKQKDNLSSTNIQLLELKIEMLNIKEELHNKDIMRHCM